MQALGVLTVRHWQWRWEVQLPVAGPRHVVVSPSPLTDPGLRPGEAHACDMHLLVPCASLSRERVVCVH